MRLRCVGDLIVTDDATVVAVFAPLLLSTIRDTAEELLMRGAVASDWELTERCFEQQTRIAELEDELIKLKSLLDTAACQ